MGIKEIKEELLKQDKDILVKHLVELYNKYDSVKEYFNFYIIPNEDELLNSIRKSKRRIFPKAGNEVTIIFIEKSNK